MWQITERKGRATLWQGKDAEGRRVYLVTRDRDGVATEPTGGGYASKRAAWSDWRDRRAAACAMGRASGGRKADAARANGKLGGRPRLDR